LRSELDRGVAEANATVSGHLLAAAKAGNVIAQIFWLKTRAHWGRRRRPMAQFRAAMPGRLRRRSSSCSITAEIPS
jgi:hypothetical protein